MDKFLFINANVYTHDRGFVENLEVLVEGGKIVFVGKPTEGVPSPFTKENAKIIDCKGNMLLPGFIDAHCHVGMWEEGIGFEGSDGNEMTDPVTPHMRAIDAINPMDEAFMNGLMGGVTTVATGPGSANVLGGTFAVIKLAGNRVDDMVVVPELAMKCAFGENPKRVYNSKNQMPMTRMGIAAKLRETLFNARVYGEKKRAARKTDDLSKMPAFDMKLEAMQRVLDGEIPLKAHAHRADDIFTGIRIAKEFGVKLTLEHCTEGHLIADQLALEGYPAVVGPSFGNKSKFELNKKTFETAGVLHKAGVKVAIMTDAPVIPIQHLPMCAAFAVKAGMDEDAAIKSISITAAEILNVDDRLGSIEVGKDADLVLWNGHPFKLESRVLYTMVDGKIVYESDN